jgi:hypothetical protein
LESPFDELTVPELQVLLENRDLPISGGKDQMLHALVAALRREAGGPEPSAEQTPEKSKLVKGVNLENQHVTEAVESKLDRGLTCLVLAGLEGGLMPDMQKRAQALAVAVRPPVGSAPLTKDVKAKVKKQRLSIRDAFKALVSTGIPNIAHTDTQALAQKSNFCMKLRTVVSAEEEETEELVEQGYFGGFSFDAHSEEMNKRQHTHDTNVINLKPVLKTNLKAKPEKPEKKNKQNMVLEEEDLDSLLTEFGVVLTAEKTAKGKKKGGKR